MLTQEQFEKESVRMWDSLRDEKHRGKNNCTGVLDCGECVFHNICSRYTPVKMIEALEKWSNEHPPKVKREKIFETFDETVLCVFCDIVDLNNVISIEHFLNDNKEWRWKVTFMCDEINERS